MKDNKSVRFEVRLTEKEKEQLKVYAANHNLSMSAAIRDLCYKAFGQEQKTINEEN